MCKIVSGVVSPLLSNLFLHYVFDKWMEKHCTGHPFARYADDGVVHCRSEEQAHALKARLKERLGECGLELHPEKTRIVCCNVRTPPRVGVYQKFDFLGYCFRPRLVRSRSGKMFVGFTPALSPSAAKKIRQRVRRWRLNLRTSLSLEELAVAVNPIIRGWVQYYGAFQRSTLISVLRQIDRHPFHSQAIGVAQIDAFQSFPHRLLQQWIETDEST